jgi:hypothetical protein
MDADNDIVAPDRGHQHRKSIGLPISGNPLRVCAFGASHGRAHGAITPALMNSPIRLRSDVAATLRPLSAVFHHDQSLWR